MVDQKYYEFKVEMTCGGCSGAVSRILERAKTGNKGVTNYDVALATDGTSKGTVKVAVDPSLMSYDELHDKINNAKKVHEGKEIEAW